MVEVLIGSFDEDALLEPGSCSHERHQVVCVDRAPPGLSGLDQFERHRYSGSLGVLTIRGLPDLGERFLRARLR